MIPGSSGPVDPSSPAGTAVDRIDLDAVGPVELDPAALVRLVLSCPGVVAMHGGLAGEVASYLPGSRVVGVRVSDDAVEVHVVARWPITAHQLAAQVWAVTVPAVDRRRVDVVIGDVLLPGGARS